MAADRQTPVDRECCPVWCSLRHDVTGDSDELVHEGVHQVVAGVVLERRQQRGGGRMRQAVPVELGAVRYRYAGDDEDWIYLGDGRQGLDLSPESAKRLARAVHRLLEGAVGGE